MVQCPWCGEECTDDLDLEAHVADSGCGESERVPPRVRFPSAPTAIWPHNCSDEFYTKVVVAFDRPPG